jgi:hypothetical protein
MCKLNDIKVEVERIEKSSMSREDKDKRIKHQKLMYCKEKDRLAQEKIKALKNGK